jgi:hypothetical protein
VFGDISVDHRTWRQTARRPVGPFWRTRRTGILNASSVEPPEWPGGPPDRPTYDPVPPDLAPNHSVKPPFHLALVPSDLEFFFP